MPKQRSSGLMLPGKLSLFIHEEQSPEIFYESSETLYNILFQEAIHISIGLVYCIVLIIFELFLKYCIIWDLVFLLKLSTTTPLS